MLLISTKKNPDWIDYLKSLQKIDGFALQTKSVIFMVEQSEWWWFELGISIISRFELIKTVRNRSFVFVIISQTYLPAAPELLDDEMAIIIMWTVSYVTHCTYFVILFQLLIYTWHLISGVHHFFCSRTPYCINWIKKIPGQLTNWRLSSICRTNFKRRQSFENWRCWKQKETGLISWCSFRMKLNRL